MRRKPAGKAHHPESTGDQTPQEIQALLDQADVEAAGRLRDLAASDDKSTAKAARRALYQLSQAGIEPSRPETSKPPAVTRSPAFAQRALATNVSGAGSRLLLFVRDDPYGGSPTILSFLLNDEKGLVDVARRKMTRRELDGYFARMRESPSTILADLPIDYARSLLAEAVSQNTALRRTIPEGYTEAVKEVGKPERDYPQPLVYEQFDADAVAKDLSISRDAERLLDQPIFRPWVLPPETIGPYAEKFVESQQSRLALDESQLTRLGDKVLDDATDALFTPDVLARYRRRLEETALILSLLERPEEAKQALYHAIKLAESGAPHSLPFARALVQRSVALLLSMLSQQQERQQQTSPSLIERV